MPSGKPAKASVATHEPPLDTKRLREALAKFLNQKIPERGRLGSCRHGIYAFFDYDGEPIYVGQTVEQLGTRVRRHLTNQRTDAVAMGVLDPFEVRTVRVWPLWPALLLDVPANKLKSRLDALEATVFSKLLTASRFQALLNEKLPQGEIVLTAAIPPSYSADLVEADVAAIREHPDVRLARRAGAIARLAQIISERKVSPQLRRVLVAQAERLQWLARERATAFASTANASDEED